GRIVLRPFAPGLRHPPQFLGAHPHRRQMRQFLAIDQPVRLGIAADHGGRKEGLCHDPVPLADDAIKSYPRIGEGEEDLIRLRARSTLTVAVIGTTQTLAWASSYYLPAILADPIAAGLGIPKSLFFGCFSGSLLLQAALGPMIGKAIDRRGGRDVLVLSNLVLAGGLVWLALAP